MDKKLTSRQKLTIKHLRMKGITSDKEVIAYLQSKMDQPRRTRRPIDKTRPYRRHSKEYYKQMLEVLT